MSLGCLECDEIGSFDTLIIFSEDGAFDTAKLVSAYYNYFTCCASVDEFKAAKKSRFAIVREKHESSQWSTPDHCTLNDTTWKLVDEEELKRRLPKIFAALLERNQVGRPDEKA